MKILGPIILAAIILALLGWWLFRNYFDTYHLATVRDGILYRDGVRTGPQFALAMQKTHVKTVVSLVDDKENSQEPFTDEIAYCKAHGIELVRIPITLGGWPSGDQIQQFLQITQNPAQQPVLVHCAQGVRRTGMLVAAYQMSVLNFDQARATGAILSFGHSQRTVGDVQRFIQTYDPATRQMTEDLPPSNE